jgi:3-deoxy-D-manno-octulosonic-acid transferase
MPDDVAGGCERTRTTLARGPARAYLVRVNGERIYETAVRAAVPMLGLAAPFNERLRRGVDGRNAALHSLRGFAAVRDASRPLVWLHAPSVGEALMAQAILGAVKDMLPQVQSAFTFFSPSAERMAARVGADWHGYLPWDRAGDVRTALDALRPSCVAFVRTEIWPVLARESAARGAGVIMVNGVLAPDSSRLGRVARALLGPGYARLDALGAVTREDAAGFERLGVRPERIRVTGDARFDQVCQRIEGIDRDRPLLRALRGAARPCMVAGSTWPADENLLIDALRRVRGWRSVIAPHEPSGGSLERLERALDDAGLRHTRLPQESAIGALDTSADVIVVDRVGVLADLYAIADTAYVGGGFGSAGLHSVVEPAALGVPVVYGPHHGNAREAARLADAGGGVIVNDARELEDVLARMLDDAGARVRSGAAARAFVESHRGGAAAGAALVIEWLSAAR